MNLIGYSDSIFLALSKYHRLRASEPERLNVFNVRQDFRRLLLDPQAAVPEDMRKVMTYFVDDAFIFGKWPFSSQWSPPLEQELWGTSAGAAHFYQVLAQYETPPVGESAREALKVFYICLALGFQGEKRVTPGFSPLALMQQLAARIGVPGTVNTPVLDTAYTCDSGNYFKPPTRYLRWVTVGLALAFVAAVVAYFVTFHSGWNKLETELNNITAATPNGVP